MWQVKIDLKGQRFERLTVIEETINPNSKSKGVHWRCICDCGVEKIVSSANLKGGHSRSCGCLAKEIAKVQKRTHGQAGNYDSSTEYSSWHQMKSRCYTITNKAYHNYGGRGIKVCDRWLGVNGFSNFFSDMGKKPSPEHSLDRYPNNNGNYEPENCRWATPKQQSGNVRTNRRIEYEGKRMILSDWARLFGVKPSTIDLHLKKKTIAQVVEFYKNKKVA